MMKKVYGLRLKSLRFTVYGLQFGASAPDAFGGGLQFTVYGLALPRRSPLARKRQTVNRKP